MSSQQTTVTDTPSTTNGSSEEEEIQKTVTELVKGIINPETREESLIKLGKIREKVPDLVLKLTHILSLFCYSILLFILNNSFTGNNIMVHTRSDGNYTPRNNGDISDFIHIHNEDTKDEHMQHTQFTPVCRLKPGNMQTFIRIEYPPLPLPIPEDSGQQPPLREPQTDKPGRHRSAFKTRKHWFREMPFKN